MTKLEKLVRAEIVSWQVYQEATRSRWRAESAESKARESWEISLSARNREMLIQEAKAHE